MSTVHQGPSGRAAPFYGRSLIWPHAVLVGIAIVLLLADWGQDRAPDLSRTVIRHPRVFAPFRP